MKRLIYSVAITAGALGSFATVQANEGAEYSKDKIEKSNQKMGAAEDTSRDTVGAAGERAMQESKEDSATKNMKDKKSMNKVGAEGERSNMDQRRAKLRQVSGEVVKIKEVKAKGGGEANKVIMIKTEKANNRLIVDLGPVDGLKDMDLKIGDKVSSEGPVVKAGGHLVLIANQMKAGDKTFKIDRKAPKEHRTAPQ